MSTNHLIETLRHLNKESAQQLVFKVYSQLKEKQGKEPLTALEEEVLQTIATTTTLEEEISTDSGSAPHSWTGKDERVASDEEVEEKNRQLECINNIIGAVGNLKSPLRSDDAQLFISQIVNEAWKLKESMEGALSEKLQNIPDEFDYIDLKATIEKCAHSLEKIRQGNVTVEIKNQYHTSHFNIESTLVQLILSVFKYHIYQGVTSIVVTMTPDKENHILLTCEGIYSSEEATFGCNPYLEKLSRLVEELKGSVAPIDTQKTLRLIIPNLFNKKGQLIG